MPAIIPIIAAVAATAGAGFAVAGAVAGTVAVATAGFAVVGALGATMSAVGAVTKNKTLSMVGLGLGVVGGVGSLASAAGVFGSEAGSIFTAANQGGYALTDQAAGSAAAAAGVAPGTPLGVPDPNLPTPPVPPPGGEMGATWAGPDVSEAAATAGSNPFQENINAKDLFTGTDTAKPVTTGEEPLAPGPRDINQPINDVKQLGGTSTPKFAGGPTSPEAIQYGNDQIAEAQGGGALKSGAPPSPEDDSLFGGIWSKMKDVGDWAEKHKVMSGMMLEGTKAMFGALSPNGMSEAQANAYNAQAAANNAAAKMRDQQTANIAAPKPQSYFPVTGNTAPQGIINRGPAQMVTGAPA